MLRFLFSITFCFLFSITHAGTITTNVTTLPSFGNVYVFQSSVPQKLLVSASGLTGSLIISAPTGFDISVNCNYGFSSSIDLSGTNISLTNIYVRCSPSSSGSLSGNIVCSSVGSAAKNVSVSGSGIAWAIPANYFSTATGNGASLKTALYNKISGHTVIPYGSGSSGLWAAFNTTDRHYDGKIWDIYSTSVCGNSPYQFTYSTDQCGNYSVEGDCYNREHSFPKSYFNDASPMYSDLFHIYATDGKVNGQRNNYPYGVVGGTPSWTSLMGSKLGNNTSGSYTGVVFEPVDEYKGDLARTYFYMATRYQNVIGNWHTNATEADAILLANNTAIVYEPWFLNILLTWHNQDPVSDKERKRNNAIYASQNNRNPFIDSPQFVQKIWGGNLPNEPTINTSTITFSNHSNTSIQINWATGNGANRLVVMRETTSSNVTPVDTVHYTANSVFGSGANLGNGNYVVYNGTGTSVNVIGLTMGVSYTVAVYEYNGWYNTCNYLISGVTGNTVVTLPVSWLNISATLQNDKEALIKWQTASETNNHFFTIERSENGIDFDAVGTLKGKGTASNISDYTFVDDVSNVNTQTIYYRVKQTDFDRKTDYSKTVLLQKVNNEIEIVAISPNPFLQNFSVTVSQHYKPLHVQLKDISGRTMINNLIYELKGNEMEFDNVGHLDAGIYFLQIQSDNGTTKSIRLVKQ